MNRLSVDVGPHPHQQIRSCGYLKNSSDSNPSTAGIADLERGGAK